MRIYPNISLLELQQYIKAKDHKGSSMVYMLKLMEEVGELADAMRRDARMVDGSIKGTIEEELYDVLYYIATIANAYEIDLQTCYEKKEILNQARFSSQETFTLAVLEDEERLKK